MENILENEKISVIEADPAELDRFVIASAGRGGAEILQSSVWLAVCAAGSGAGSVRVFFAWKGPRIAASLLAVENSFFGRFKYLYSPRGPIFAAGTGSAERAEIAAAFAAKFAAEKKYIFWRLEPEDDLPLPLRRTIDLQPKKTLLLSLDRTSADLLKEMHQKTRYNIRLAEKKGVSVSEATAADIDDFWRLMQRTGERDSFGIHSREHYLRLLEAGSLAIKLFFAEQGGKRIAAGIFSFFGGKAIYLHGASDDDYKNLMAPYALQFAAIERARAEGCRLYDFYGVDEKKWPGVTRFKRGFGGFEHSYAGTKDFVLRPAAYSIYNLLRRLRRLKIW